MKKNFIAYSDRTCIITDNPNMVFGYIDGAKTFLFFEEMAELERYALKHNLNIQHND